MPIAGMTLLLALAAAAPAPKTKARAKAPAKAAAAKPAGERAQWIGASGLEAGAEKASPEGVMLWARLLAKEKSMAAASRAYEGLVRRWPGAPVAERALRAAARAALAAGQVDRALKLLRELGARWPEGATATERDRVEVAIAESRLAAAGAESLPHKKARRAAKIAYREFMAILRRQRAGPVAERAALGRARALHALGKIGGAIKALEDFLRAFPRSQLVRTARKELVAIRSRRARGRSPERGVLIRGRKNIGWDVKTVPQGSEDAAILKTYRAIAARQAELKIKEAKLYVRLKKPRAAETVLRSVLRRYGDTSSAARAARMLEELSEE